MKSGIYSFIRILFGVYLIWLGINNIHKLEQNATHITNTIDNFEKSFSLEGIAKFLYLEDFANLYKLNLKDLQINFEPIKSSANEIVYLMNFSLILGGLLCSLGFSISFGFIFIGLFLDILFIHNFYYFRDEKMKVNVLKIISIFAGAFHII